MNEKPYGGITRNDRVNDGGDGPWCDKAWHLSHEKVAATAVLRCRPCGVIFARCAQCNRGCDHVKGSMQLHIDTHHRRWKP